MFYKLSANGNTFIIIYHPNDVSTEKYKLLFEEADGLIILQESQTSTDNFIIYNKDGSRAKICGNGLLASTAFYKNILKDERKEYLFHTDIGYFKTEIDGDKYKAHFPIPTILSSTDKSAFVSTGNLHHIEVVNKIDPNLLLIRQDNFGAGINYHLLEKKRDDYYMMVSLENGVGFTKCCGSGSIASFTFLNNLFPSLESVYLQTLGGLVKVYKVEDGLAFEGRVKILYKGILYEENIRE